MRHSRVHAEPGQAERDSAVATSLPCFSPVPPRVAPSGLLVGPVDDPAERQADRLADMVLQELRGETTVGTGRRGEQTARGSAVVAREADIGASGPVGPEGGPVPDHVAKEIDGRRRGGRALETTVRQRMERGFGVGFGAVRIHTGAEASRLNQALGAHAFTTGNDIFFGSGAYKPETEAGERILAHELAHTLQQNDHPQRTTIRRHSAWEHMLLGSVTPEELRVIGATEDVKDGSTIIAKGKKIDKAEVLHVLEQEMRRLAKFQNSPPQVAATQINQEKAADHEDPEWQVRLVAIPSISTKGNFGKVKQHPPLVLTYGELNTMADYFGSVEELKAADPVWRDRLVRGVRQNTLQQLLKMYQELSGQGKKAAKAAVGITSTAFGKNALKLGGIPSELALMGIFDFKRAKKKGVGGQDSTKYAATLARNACHFVPDSWHAWANYHEKARQAALAAYDAKQKTVPGAQVDPTRPITEAEVTQASEVWEAKANEALLNNGFGDHYLQDSYAAGHLINKTQIMQFYVQWLDKKKWFWDAHSNADWRRIQQMAYQQAALSDPAKYDKDTIDKSASNPAGKPPSDPQSVENLKTGWEAQAQALGLEVPQSVLHHSPSWPLVVWWAKESLKTGIRPEVKSVKDLKAAAAKVGIAPDRIGSMITELEKDGVILRTDYKVTDAATKRPATSLDTTYALREAYRPKSKKSLAAAQASPAAWNRAMKSITYEDYLKFMQSSFIQKATNALHNHFCEEGLFVSTGDGFAFKIYGDNNMLKEGSSAGVAHSAQTAHLSRKAIEDIITAGATAIHTTNIVQRFPDAVLWEHDRLPIQDWQKNGGELQAFCEKTIFPGMSEGIANLMSQKFLPGVAMASLGEVAAVHPGHAF